MNQQGKEKEQEEWDGQEEIEDEEEEEEVELSETKADNEGVNEEEVVDGDEVELQKERNIFKIKVKNGFFEFTKGLPYFVMRAQNSRAKVRLSSLLFSSQCVSANGEDSVSTVIR